STIHFKNLQEPRKPQKFFVGPFIITKLHGKTTVEVILTPEFDRKHPVFPVKKPNVTPILPKEEKQFLKIVKEKELKENNQDTILYLFRYKNGIEYDEWLLTDKAPNNKTTFRAHGAAKREQT
ncbi:hypothetical protein CROQUDRAFT_39589, partial [Cronartium quercuum f. sp. fusiforme G11]